MSLTTQLQEPFQSRGTLTSGSPGNLGSVNGTFYKYAGGPKTSSDTSANGYGWSADLRLSSGTNFDIYHTMSVPSAAQTLGLFSTFHFIESFTPSASTYTDLQIISPSGTQCLVAIKSNTDIWVFPGGSVGWVDTGFACPTGQWFELRSIWQHASGNNFNYIGYMRICGTSTWTQLFSYGNINNASATITSVVGGGDGNGGAAPTWRGRYGMPTICSLGSIADATLSLPSVVDPQQTPYTWYTDPINGNDASNTGTSPDSAWQTAANLTTLSQYYGIFGGRSGVNWLCKADSSAANITLDATVLGALIAQGQGLTLNVFQTATLAAAALSASYAQGIIPNGDSVLIADNGAQEWRLDASLALSTPGIYFAPASGDPVHCKTKISALKQVLHGSWSLTSGQTTVWQTTAPYQYSCPLQNRRPMNAVSSVAACAALPGSFYADLGSPTATIYVNPFGGLDPTQSANDGMMEVSWLYQPILINAGALTRGFDITGTVLYDGSLAIQGYSIQIQAPSCINAVLDCNASRYDKHCFGATPNGSTNGRNIWINLSASGGNPQLAFGGQTAFVDYYNLGSGNQAYYDNCNVAGGNSMVIASTSYANNTGQSAYICHGTTGTEMTKLTWVNCNFESSAFLAPSIQQSVTPSNVTLTTGGAAPFIKPGEF